MKIGDKVICIKSANYIVTPYRAKNTEVFTENKI